MPGRVAWGFSAFHRFPPAEQERSPSTRRRTWRCSKSVPRDSASACPYIFPTRLIGVYNPWDRIRAAQDWPTFGCMTCVTRSRACSSTRASRQARRLGRTAAASVLLGSDPQTHRQELRSIPTLVELVRDRYLPHAKANKRSWHIDEMNLRRHVLPALGRLTLDEITNEHVAKLISDMRGDGYAAGTTNNVLMLLCRIFNLAQKWKVPGAGDNPTSGLDRAPPNERQRFSTAEETDRLIASLAEDENRAAAQAIMLLLLTGARRNEITRAKWENVDWAQRVLRVPVSKSGKPRTIALNTAALAVLKSIPRDPACPYIFPTRLIGIFNPWDRIRRRAGLADVRLHDLAPLVRELARQPGRLALRGARVARARLAPDDAKIRAPCAADFAGRGRGCRHLRYTYRRKPARRRRAFRLTRRFGDQSVV